MRSTVRLRLTLLYGAAFFVAGAVLVGLMYAYFGQSLGRSAGDGGAQQLVREFLATQPARPRLARSAELMQALAEQAQRRRRETLREMLLWSLICLAVVGVFATGAGWLLAGRALRPLQRITATARRVAGTSLHERIALDGPSDELKDLADTFDAMLERLDRAFDGQRRFVANASHELRTPLTINRTLLEVALDDPDVPPATRSLGATLLEVNQRHERLIDGLLLLATTDQRLTDRRRVRLADLVRDATERPAPDGVEIRTDVQAVAVDGDPVLLERLLGNLVDNALRYNVPERGWVLVRLRQVGDYAELHVANSGPRVPAAEVDGLFEPFRRRAGAERLAGTRGAGLGLSIVRSIAHAHDGTVRAQARPDGGLAVTVLLTRAPA
ncbi:sensor histidine kinase [Nocardia shimofusensis]|uniref:sensor histidine kinase n=1 Tax=Nocardia shimofusensis TaxID=228596 RepID=UPI00082F6D90|nr:ATP-binding protein [Nocardia shimofusensis]